MSTAFTIADCLEGVCAVGLGWEVGFWTEVGDDVTASLAWWLPLNTVGAIVFWVVAETVNLRSRGKRMPPPRLWEWLLLCCVAVPLMILTIIQAYIDVRFKRKKRSRRSRAKSYASNPYMSNKVYR